MMKKLIPWLFRASSEVEPPTVVRKEMKVTLKTIACAHNCSELHKAMLKPSPYVKLSWVCLTCNRLFRYHMHVWQEQEL